MSCVFTEAVLEQAIIDKFIAEGYEYVSGDNLHRELTDVLIEEDLKTFLSLKYASEHITASEIDSIVRTLRYASAQPIYSANKSMFFRMVEGETFVREDRSAKDFHLQLIDFDTDNNRNIVKIVNQITIKGSKATRRPDAIVYLNGLPIVVMEFKSAIKEDTTIHDDELVQAFANEEGCTEQLKATDQLLWVRKMNNAVQRAREVVNAEIIYN